MQDHEVCGHFCWDLDLLAVELRIHAEEDIVGVPVVS